MKRPSKNYPKSCIWPGQRQRHNRRKLFFKQQQTRKELEKSINALALTYVNEELEELPLLFFWKTGINRDDYQKSRFKEIKDELMQEHKLTS